MMDSLLKRIEAIESLVMATDPNARNLPLWERFANKWTPVTESGCWLWDGGVNSKGYGQDRIAGAGSPRMAAHRVSWMIYQGAIPEGMLVLHKCDVPSCVNPDHLFLGTPKDNTDDMVRKGRASWQR